MRSLVLLLLAVLLLPACGTATIRTPAGRVYRICSRGPALDFLDCGCVAMTLDGWQFRACPSPELQWRLEARPLTPLVVASRVAVPR